MDIRPGLMVKVSDNRVGVVVVDADSLIANGFCNVWFGRFDENGLPAIELSCPVLYYF